MKKSILAFLVLILWGVSIAAKEPTATAQSRTIVLGAGCFWGAEKAYAALPGVIDAVSGYAGGSGVMPTYRAISDRSNKMNPKNHAEVVEVTYDHNHISVQTLLESFFERHDPTQVNRQGNDIGSQYRSIILTTNPTQSTVALQVSTRYQELLTQAGYGKITTQISPLDIFYPAENYHQDYLVKNPDGYCPDHSTGVHFTQKEERKLDNSAIAKGPAIVVIEAQGYCPYCEKFKTEVANTYAGSIPMVFRTAAQLHDLEITTPTWATPTILFLRDGAEVFGNQGYMAADSFYRALGHFKLGDSEAYNIAFKKGTESRFCRQYEIFKDTPDGVFVDKLSGAALFDTQDRFDSGTGWLSFSKSVDNAVYERADHSFGMRRTEIRSASSDIHLGHVFPDGPRGQPRYCINATVLEFIPRRH